MYYPCSESKGADQLHGYREADLRLCLRICKNLVFSGCGSNVFVCLNSCQGPVVLSIFSRNTVVKRSTFYAYAEYVTKPAIFLFVQNKCFSIKMKKFRKIIRMSNTLDSHQARQFVGPDMGPKCFRCYQQKTQASKKLSRWKCVLKSKILSL